MSPRGRSLPAPRYSAAWYRYFPIQYALIRLADPAVRLIWRRFGLGNVIELRVPGRRSGTSRSVLLGLLRDGDRLFLGHPNGHVDWTRNLQAAGRATLAIRPPTAISIRAHELPDGDLRDRAILATTQHVFPGNVIYRLAWRHIRAAGAFFEIELAE